MGTLFVIIVWTAVTLVMSFEKRKSVDKLQIFYFLLQITFRFYFTQIVLMFAKVAQDFSTRVFFVEKIQYFSFYLPIGEIHHIFKGWGMKQLKRE